MYLFKGKVKDLLADINKTMKLPVKSDITVYEVKINADCYCDMCGEYYNEEEMKSVQGDAAVCEYCWEHYN